MKFCGIFAAAGFAVMFGSGEAAVPSFPLCEETARAPSVAADFVEVEPVGGLLIYVTSSSLFARNLTDGLTGSQSRGLSGDLSSEFAGASTTHYSETHVGDGRSYFFLGTSGGRVLEYVITPDTRGISFAGSFTCDSGGTIDIVASLTFVYNETTGDEILVCVGRDNGAGQYILTEFDFASSSSPGSRSSTEVIRTSDNSDFDQVFSIVGDPAAAPGKGYYFFNRNSLILSYLDVDTSTITAVAGDGTNANTDGVGTGASLAAIVKMVPYGTGLMLLSKAHVFGFIDLDTKAYTTNLIGQDNTSGDAKDVSGPNTRLHGAFGFSVSVSESVVFIADDLNSRLLECTLGPLNTCFANVMVAVDTTFKAFWEEQYVISYETIDALVTEIGDGIAAEGAGIKMGVVEVGVNSVTDVVTFSDADSESSSALSTLAQTKQGQPGNARKAKNTDFLGLFGDGSYGADIASDDVASYFLIFSDGTPGYRKQVKQLKGRIKAMKAALPNSRITPKLICVQTWPVVENFKVFSLCDAYFVYGKGGATGQVMAQQIHGYLCADLIDDDQREPDPCEAAQAKNRRQCKAVKRNPLDGTESGTQVRVCSWGKKTCSVKNKYTNLFKSLP